MSAWQWHRGLRKRLWAQRQTQRPPTPYSTSRSPTLAARDHNGRFESTPATSSAVPMELDVTRVTTTLAKTAAEWLEYHKQGRCWGCGQMGHVRAKCLTNPSKPLSLAASERADMTRVDSGKGKARDWEKRLGTRALLQRGGKLMQWRRVHPTNKQGKHRVPYPCGLPSILRPI